MCYDFMYIQIEAVVSFHALNSNILLHLRS